MDREKTPNNIKACWEKEEPFCGSSCPFHYDIREFTARLKRGSFNAAFRTFANAVGFPAIVAALCDAPCAAVCPRNATDAAVDLRRLEQSALDYAANTRPNSYNLPPKQQKIAIVGGGLSGLGCALRLTNRKYQVTLFEKSARLGGRLWRRLEPELFLADIEKQFMYEQYTLRLQTNITEAAALLDEFEAVYIAGGADSDGLGLEPVKPAAALSAPYASSLPGIFMGGALTGATDMEALAQGLQAAGLLEAYLKTGQMKGAVPHRPTRMRLAPGLLSYQKPVEAAGAAYHKEQALEEARRCLGCRCDACYRHCPLMHYFEKFPLRIADEVAVTINPGTLDGNGTVATRLISTCNHCGLCAEICPQHIDVGNFLLVSHQAMRSKGAMPWAFHDFWLRDLAQARSQAAAFCGSPQKKPRYLFFPGCQLGASNPHYVTGAYALLRGVLPDTAIRLGCCGAPALWAGDEPLRRQVTAEIQAAWQEYGQPLVIAACPTCLEIFAQYLPEIKTVFLPDFLSEQGIKPLTLTVAEEIAVFDPCAMRRQEQSRATVRSIARQAGYQPQELAYRGATAQCCSFGGQIDITNPPYKKWLVQERINASALPYLVYCSNCRDIFAAAGKRAIHVLELYEGCGRQEAPASGLEQRQLNRSLVKEEIIRMYFPEQEAAAPPTAGQPRLTLAPGLEQKLDQERIFIKDIAAVIQICQETCRRLRLPNGHYAGHAQLGYMTYWAEYLPHNGGYTVFNAYAHRMSIAEQGAKEGAEEGAKEGEGHGG